MRLNVQFNPFTYEELIRPIADYNEAYNALADSYATLSDQTEAFRNEVNQHKNSNAYIMHSKYSDDLNNIIDNFSQGMTSENRAALIKMKRRYDKEISPIAKAAARRNILAEEQRKAEAANPTMLWEKRASDISLDDFIENPNIGYGKSYSGAALAAQVSAAATALAKELSNNPEKIRAIGNGDFYEYVKQRGFSSEAILAAIKNEVGAPPILLGLVDNVINSSGIRDWGDPNTIKKAIDYAKQGLWSAVGESQSQIVDNWRAKLKEQENAQIREDNRKAIAAQHARLNSLAINPLNIYSSRELSEEEKKYNDTIKEYSQYFYKENGQWKMNYEGWKEYNRKIEGTTGKTKVTTEGTVILTEVQKTYNDSPFKKFMDSMGIKGISPTKFGDTHRKGAGVIWGKYVDESPAARTARYDATSVTEYDYPIAGTQQDDMKNAIMTASRGLSLKEVDYDSKSKQFMATDEEITMEDLKSDKYKVTATRFSPYGTTVMIQDDKGNVRRFRMPAGINTTNEQNRDRAMVAAQQWQQVVNTGQYTDAKGNIHQATPDEITYAQQQYAQAIQQAYLFHSQLGVQNKTKEQEFNYYGY